MNIKVEVKQKRKNLVCVSSIQNCPVSIVAFTFLIVLFSNNKAKASFSCTHIRTHTLILKQTFKKFIISHKYVIKNRKLFSIIFF